VGAAGGIRGFFVALRMTRFCTGIKSDGWFVHAGLDCGDDDGVSSCYLVWGEGFEGWFGEGVLGVAEGADGAGSADVVEVELEAGGPGMVVFWVGWEEFGDGGEGAVGGVEDDVVLHLGG
jgi:hypothetical protein